ncbi:NAD(P)H dehydrogenase (quinone) [uncultured archaeon]|nr:NAD(P)H dehydrogenase (quinone) [uncultured archaeon]
MINCDKKEEIHEMMKLLAMVLSIMLGLSIAAFGSMNSDMTGGNNNSTMKGQQSSAEENKILVAYFSHTGNTREIANQIHEKVGGDIFEIVTVDPYPDDYSACVDKAKQEQDGNYRPELATKVEKMDSYDVVFVGYPNWWGTMPMAVFTFLEEYDLSGKTVIPFCTHEGSGLGKSVEAIKNLCPQSNILDGLEVRGSRVKNAQNEVSQWLDKIGMAEQ